ALSLRSYSAGHADRRYRAAVADLSAAATGRAGLRLDCRLLSGAGEYDAWPAFGRTQSLRSVYTLWRIATPGSLASQAAFGVTVYSRRLENRRRPLADRRSGGGDRRRLGLRRFRGRLSQPRIPRSPQPPPHVRRAVIAIGCRNCNFLFTVVCEPCGATPLA